MQIRALPPVVDVWDCDIQNISDILQSIANKRSLNGVLVFVNEILKRDSGKIMSLLIKMG